MAEELIVNLTVAEGTKGDPVGSYHTTRKSYGSIVFLPPEAKAFLGKEVRVRLEEIRPDKRGTMMYRGQPAPEVFAEKWQDNGDGTLSRVNVGTNWLLAERVAEVLETRAVGTREVVYTTRTDRKVVWGQDLASSYVEQTEVKVFHAQRETVQGGTLSWDKTAEREERGVPQSLTITKINVGYEDTWTGFRHHKLEPVYQDEWKVAPVAYFGSSEWVRDDHATWGSLPTWLKNQVMADFPICSCGRARVDRNPDGYGKCEKCRAEEVCNRCGKTGKITLVAGEMVCDSCKPYAQLEELVNTHVAIETRQAIAALATKLAAFEPLPRETGEAVLKSGLEHIESDWTRQHIAESGAGYRWYYFADDGIYGSKLPQAALQILQYLPLTTGNQLVEMVGWLAGEPKSDERYDFYYRTQVKGESLTPSLTEDSLKKLIVAVKVRGSADDLAKVQAWLTSHERPDRRQAQVVEAAKKILESYNQDYSEAVEAINAYEKELATREARAAAGEIWLDAEVRVSTESRTSTKVWAVNPDGSALDPLATEMGGHRDRHVSAYYFGDLRTDVLIVSWSHDNYGYTETEVWEVHYLPQTLTDEQRAKVAELRTANQQYFVGNGTGWDLTKVGSVVYSTFYQRSDHTSDEEKRVVAEQWRFPLDVTKWELRGPQEWGETYEEAEAEEPTEESLPQTPTTTKVVWPYPRLSSEERALKNAETAWVEASEAYAYLEMDQTRAREELDAATQSYLERAEAEAGTKPVEAGTVFEVSGFELCKTPQSEERLEYGPVWDWPSNTNVYLVLDMYHKASDEIQPGTRQLVRVRAKSREQLFFFKGYKRDAAGKSVSVTSYLVQVVTDPAVFDAQIKAAEEKMNASKAKVEELKAKIA